MQRGRFVWDGSHCDRKEFSCKTQCAECIMTDKPVQNSTFYIDLPLWSAVLLKRAAHDRGFSANFVISLRPANFSPPATSVGAWRMP